MVQNDLGPSLPVFTLILLVGSWQGKHTVGQTLQQAQAQARCQVPEFKLNDCGGTVMGEISKTGHKYGTSCSAQLQL